MVVQKTGVLEIYCCPCKGCNRILVELGQFREVQRIDRDAEKLKASILVTGDPCKVIKALKNHGRRFKYFEHTLDMKKVKSLKKPDNQKTRLVKNTKAYCPKCNHELKLKSYKQFACDGCKEDGFGSRYSCKYCGHSLHEECASRKPIIWPDFLQGSAFKFYQPSSTCARPCYACGKAIRGYFYRCKSNKLDLHLHPYCSNLKSKLFEMDFVPHDKKILSSSKSVCCENKMRRGSCSYISTCKKYHFHVYCITKMLHEASKKGVTNVSTPPKKKDLQLIKANNSNRGGGGFGEILKPLTTFAGTIVGYFLGDPTGMIVKVLIEFFWKMPVLIEFFKKRLQKSPPKLLPKLPSK